jgi:hypothetical protein
MKRFVDWFKELPEDEMANAIRNTEQSTLNLHCPNMQFALKASFVWVESPEGHDYWQKIAERYETE